MAPLILFSEKGLQSIKLSSVETFQLHPIDQDQCGYYAQFQVQTTQNNILLHVLTNFHPPQ